MKITKVASVSENGDISNPLPPIGAMILSDCSNTEPTTVNLNMPILIGKGVHRRKVLVEVPIGTSAFATQNNAPISFDWPDCFGENQGQYHALFLFRSQLFLATTSLLNADNGIEATLLVKKQVYSENNSLKRLKQEVEAMEGAIEQTNTIKRTAIPDAVKLLVYARDDGKCVRCNSATNLHFDHIIPVAKGGSNLEQNIQILCEYCNLQKSDKIAF